MNSHQRRVVFRAFLRAPETERTALLEAALRRPGFINHADFRARPELGAEAVYRLIRLHYHRRLRSVPEPFFPPDGYADQNCMNCARPARCPVACSGDKCPGGHLAHPAIARRNRAEMNRATAREEHYQRTQGWLS